MKTGSKELIRDINSHLILENIIEEQTISRAALAQKTGLTKATVSAIVADLIERDLVIEIGSDNTSLGRKPILLTYNAKCGHSIAIDLNLDNITVLVSDLRGQNCSLKLYPHELNRDQILTQLKAIIEETISTLPPTTYGVIGIGIGIHGIVHNNEVVFSPYTPYENLPFKQYLESHLNIPIHLENEANLSVIGEQTFFYSVPNVVGVSVHSGIGIGIIINHNLYTGHNGNAGEFGHTIVERNGRLCPCGNRGCLEQYASERMILQEYSEQHHISTVDIDTFIESYKKNDIIAITLLDEFIAYMAITLNNLSATFNPDIIVLNSAFVINIPRLITKLQDRLHGRLSKHCTLVPSGLQDTSILLGAICVSVKHFLELDRLTFIRPMEPIE